MSAVAAEIQSVTEVPAVSDRRAYRMSSIDILRGLVIVVMALDHVRDYMMAGSLQDPIADHSIGPLLFATRWITHFCAPTFVFLAGTSAGLMSLRKSRSELARFLLVRGLWLIGIEVLVISTATSFSPWGIAELGGRTYVGLQVIWAIGAAMVALAGAQYLGRRACLAIGAAIICGHNLLDVVWPAASSTGATGPLWVALHARQLYAMGQFSVYFSYPVLPWIGVMLLGYASAGLFQGPAQVWQPRLARIGIGLTLAFVVLRALNVYGDPQLWQAAPGNPVGSVMSFLATTKYPPSLLYLLMTLGPAAIVCAYAERLHGRVRDVLLTYGRAPFAFYVAHVYLIHGTAMALGVAQGFAAQQFLTHYRYFPKGFGVGLGGVYLIWIAVVASLYPLCRWVTALKARRSDWWLSYV
ncbi:MAG TPA: heparan-alpha-glucosaminide N-acetyltransferase domain-containing protein [Gammaproteobacteria bacterium]